MLADVILTNGRIYTMDAAFPRAEAVAVTGKCIRAVGSRADIVTLCGPQTQAIDLRDSKSGPGVKAAYDVIRDHVEHLEEDRPLHLDNNAATEAVRTWKVLDAVEKAVGPLES